MGGSLLVPIQMDFVQSETNSADVGGVAGCKGREG